MQKSKTRFNALAFLVHAGFAELLLALGRDAYLKSVPHFVNTPWMFYVLASVVCTVVGLMAVVLMTRELLLSY